MTDIFPYEILTWPDVAALPRHTPLVLPLGAGFQPAELTEALGRPERIGLLPALPFGWQESGLAVPEPLLRAYVTNLLDSLREDDFTQVYVVAPPAVDLGQGQYQLTLSQSPSHDEAALLPADAERGKVVIIPLGHTEQHGYHLPLSTDTLIIDAIATGTAAAVPEQATCLPVFPYGVSTHRASFAGTLNAGGRAFEDFWLAVVDTLVARGFDRFYLMTGHGGNGSFLVNIIKYAGERHRRIFCATAWLHTAGPQGVAALQQHRRSPAGGMGHAGELETSMILHLRPDLVHQERVVDEMHFISTPSYSMEWVGGGPLIANPPWDDDTISGAYGAGSLATAEHGKIWLDVAIAEKAAHVAEIHEQHNRREARRQQGYGLWGKPAE
jgi:creatinine amidohydrolase